MGRVAGARVRVVLGAALVVGSLSGGFLVAQGTAGASAPASYTCDGTYATPGFIPTGTFSSLNMPAGTLCVVVGTVDIQKPVTLGSGSGLAVMSGSLTANGPFTVGTGAAFGTLAGNTTPVTINGPVRVGTDGAFILGTETPFGPLFATINGRVTAMGASTVNIHNTTVGGPITLNGGGGHNPVLDALGFPFGPPFGYNYNDLEDNHIGGGVTETGYGGIWSGVIRNFIGGPFTFSNNTESAAFAPTPVDEYDIGSNFIQGPATCNNNDPAPNMGTSRGYLSIVNGPIRGDQAATCTGVTTGITGPPV